MTSCSGSAEESAISAFWPPVSAISGRSAASRAASARLIARAVSVEPVKATPATRGSLRQRRADVAPSPGRNCSDRFRHAGFVQQLHREVRRSRLVCSAGLAITLLPAASAAATWPMKIASGKFHGLMHTNTPRPCSCSSFDSPVGPGSFSGCAEQLARPARRSSAGSRPPRALRRRRRRASCRLPSMHSAMNSRHARFEQVGGVFEDLRARRRRRAVPVRLRGHRVARAPVRPSPASAARQVPDLFAAVGGIGHGDRRRRGASRPAPAAPRSSGLHGGVEPVGERAQLVRRWRG